ncbi:MAG: hypothetical protein AABY10_01210 [Nanoarchaeota archaeon]
MAEENADKPEKRNKRTISTPYLCLFAGFLGGFSIGSGVTIATLDHLDRKELETMLRPAIVYPFQANDDAHEDYLVINERGDQFVFIGQEDGYAVKSEKYLADKSQRFKSELERNVTNFFLPISYSQAKNSVQPANKEEGK